MSNIQAGPEPGTPIPQTIAELFQRYYTDLRFHTAVSHLRIIERVIIEQGRLTENDHLRAIATLERTLGIRHPAEALEPRPIMPGDMVEHVRQPGLNPREVMSVGRDFLTLRLVIGVESGRLPLANYRTIQTAEERR